MFLIPALSNLAQLEPKYGVPRATLPSKRSFSPHIE